MGKVGKVKAPSTPSSRFKGDRQTHKNKIDKRQKDQKNRATKQKFASKKNESRDNPRDNNAEDAKVHYVLNPKKMKEKLNEAKKSEQQDKQKDYQVRKRKRNAAYLKTTDKGQPKLNARMKVLYSQIKASCE